MNEIERFLAAKQLFRCARLSASITQDQCEKNRTRKHNLTTDVWTVGPCQGCPGLGEKVEMSKIPESRMCIIKGCGKYKVIDDYCTTHAKQNGLGKPQHTDDVKRQMQLDKVAKMQAAKAAKKAAAPVATLQDAVVAHTKLYAAPDMARETRIASEAFYLRQLVESKLKEWIAELDGAKDTRERARYFLDMCTAIEFLGI